MNKETTASHEKVVRVYETSQDTKSVMAERKSSVGSGGSLKTSGGLVARSSTRKKERGDGLCVSGAPF